VPDHGHGDGLNLVILGGMVHPSRSITLSSPSQYLTMLDSAPFMSRRSHLASRILVGVRVPAD
jgi:hypothetical protein